ncbi:unnamed protein product [Euphydryas editha]|uniref:Uncharacterized protein n=1 Tax=Euphydryas editha TaxID=104508 RepID=A0AAU9TCU3_EUPED|nr:unnamed protein product [Euphydryas editha]
MVRLGLSLLPMQATHIAAPAQRSLTDKSVLLSLNAFLSSVHRIM